MSAFGAAVEIKKPTKHVEAAIAVISGRGFDSRRLHRVPHHGWNAPNFEEHAACPAGRVFCLVVVSRQSRRTSRPTPWAVAAAARLLAKDNPARARELAHRYFAYVMGFKMSEPRIFANHLIHTIEQEAQSNSFPEGQCGYHHARALPVSVSIRCALGSCYNPPCSRKIPGPRAE
jgi:hypothetical protein